jgi:hypothetical protein
VDSWLQLVEQALWPAVVLVLGLFLRAPLASAQSTGPLPCVSADPQLLATLIASAAPSSH